MPLSRNKPEAEAYDHTPPRAARHDVGDSPRAAVGLLVEAGRLGLCATCEAAPTCCYRSRQDGPVLYCEEFT